MLVSVQSVEQSRALQKHQFEAETCFGYYFSREKIEPEILNEDLVQLKNYMMEEKPFLNPALTIQDIAREINVPVRELSVLINHQLGQHFYDFVNTYRIEQAMKILKDPSKSKLTILEILYEVGFNSKSSFNTAFRKHIGKTPTEFRKSL